MSVHELDHSHITSLANLPEFGTGRLTSVPEPQPGQNYGAYLLDHLVTPPFNHSPSVSTIAPVQERPMVEGGGTAFTYDVPFTDGTLQRSTLLVPYELMSHVVTDLSLPWLLSDRGIMRGVAELLVNAHIACRVNAPAATHFSEGTSTANKLAALKNISIARAAHDQNKSLQLILKNHPELSALFVALMGASKGASEALAKGNPNYAAGAEPVYIDATAPAPFEEYRPRHLIELASVVGPEFLTVVKYVGKRALSPDFWHYEIATLDFSPEFIFSAIFTYVTLFGGHSGANFRACDPSIDAHFDLHGKDKGTMPNQWLTQVENRQATTKHTTHNWLKDLRHMHIPHRVKYAAARVVTAIEMNPSGSQPGAVDYEKVKNAQPSDIEAWKTKITKMAMAA